jgi:hypothetical protein
MQLFETSTGFIFSFGFDMIERKRSPNRMCWCDPKTKSWLMEPRNQAGTNDMIFELAPEFIREITGEHLIAYQPGICIELVYIGAPYVWACTVLRTNT